MLNDLIREAESSYKREKFDLETLQHLKDRTSFQKKIDELQITNLMPEYKSMVKLEENTGRLSFLTQSANLITQNGIMQCYNKMQDRIEHRREKIQEKTVAFKEEEAVVLRLKAERALVKKLIFDEKKKLRKMKNINDRLKLTEEEKREIERRTQKEI